VISAVDFVDFTPAYEKGVFVRSSVRLRGSSQFFDVAYEDSGGVTATGMVGQSVWVTGPNGYSAMATAVNFVSRDANRAVVTYRIDGVDVTGRYAVAVNGAVSANVTLFYLVPDQWEGGSVGRRRRR